MITSNNFTTFKYNHSVDLKCTICITFSIHSSHFLLNKPCIFDMFNCISCLNLHLNPVKQLENYPNATNNIFMSNCFSFPHELMHIFILQWLISNVDWHGAICLSALQDTWNLSTCCQLVLLHDDLFVANFSFSLWVINTLIFKYTNTCCKNVNQSSVCSFVKFTIAGTLLGIILACNLELLFSNKQSSVQKCCTTSNFTSSIELLGGHSLRACDNNESE